MTRIVVFFLLSLFPLLSCSTAGKNDQASARKPAVPADFSIEFGEGGGFTAQWQGYRIDADGTVVRWSRRAGLLTEDSLGTLPADTLLHLWERIREGGFTRLEPSEPGNMTRFVQIRADSLETTLQWPVGGSIPEELKAVARFFDQCRTAVSSLQK